MKYIIELDVNIHAENESDLKNQVDQLFQAIKDFDKETNPSVLGAYTHTNKKQLKQVDIDA